jgi:nucleotide-binding universal stress UspA family protein
VIKRILTPLDGTKQSEAILPYVSKVAAGLGAPVVLLSVLDQGSLGVGRSYFSKLYQRAESGARERLEAAAGVLAEAGISVEQVVVSGKSAEEIVRAAYSHDCSMIMMSTHGRNALARGILGSVTDAVVHSAHMPVLTLTPDRARTYRGEDTTLNSVLVALDGSELAEAVLPYVIDLASRLSLEILLVRVVPPIHAFWMDHQPEELAEEQEQAEAEAKEYLERTASMLSDRAG